MEIKNANELIGESSPYLDEINPVLREGVKSHGAQIGLFSSYQGESFYKLLKEISTIGSCAVADLYGKNDMHYFLGEKLRIRKCADTISTAPLMVRVIPVILSERKAKSLIDVRTQEGDILYRFELDYTIFTASLFKKLMRSHFVENHLDLPNDQTMPLVTIRDASKENFIIDIDKFTPAQTKGHFDNYPIVPAVFILNCFLKGIKLFALSKDLPREAELVIDSMELYANQAMPVNVDYEARVQVVPLRPKLKLFLVELFDKSSNFYGAYLITLEA